jgi:hypothetical protein
MDQTIPAYMATELHGRLPTATRVIIEKGTHKAMHKGPEFFPAIVEFVSAHDFFAPASAWTTSSYSRKGKKKSTLKISSAKRWMHR